MILGLWLLSLWVAVWKFVRMFWLPILIFAPIIFMIMDSNSKKVTQGITIIPGSPIDKGIKFLKKWF